MRAMLVCLVSAAAAVLACAAPGAAQDVGWQYRRLDMEVTIEPAARRMVVHGVAVLEKAGAAATEAVLVLNSREPAMRFERVVVRNVDARVDTLTAAPRHIARLTVDSAVAVDSLVVEFTLRWLAPSSQVMVTDSIALASWVEAWYPLLIADGGRVRRYAAAGETRFRLPPGWHAVSNGVALPAETDGDVAVQRWSTAVAVHRSFAAAPYRSARARAGDREIGVYLLRADSASAARQADVLARAIGAMEAVWGPYPYAGYAIAEVPDGVVTWAASSEQGFIMATTRQFGDEGNLPLFAHEAAHAWWGNRVATGGVGGLLVSESLAQYGAVVAIEALEGRDAMNEFLRFSRRGYNRYQSAAGYFEIVRLGGDKALSALTNDRWDHNLSDSKGHWFYHMMRQRLGDARFFGVLREIQREFAGRSLSLPELRAAFVRAGPEDAGLADFMAQWLDRTGAPVLEHRWWATDRGAAVHLEIAQSQAELYDVPLTVEIELMNGHHVRRTVRLSERSHAFRFDVHASPVAVRIDPDHHLLHWRPEYGPPPG
jgi:aminopeptidase N